MRIHAALFALALVPLSACGGDDDKDEVRLGCIALVSCLDDCAPNDTACEHACHARAVPAAINPATALHECIEDSRCGDDTACIEEACGDERLVCSGIVGTGPADGGVVVKDSGKHDAAGEPTHVTVNAVYHRQDEPLTAFVVANVTDSFDFEIPWPLENGSTTPTNQATSNDAYVDTRGNCLAPTAESSLELFQVTSVEVIGASLGATSSKYIPAITRGVGEGNCAVDSATDAQKTGESSFTMSFPLEFFTTTPHGTYTVVEGYWTFTYVVD